MRYISQFANLALFKDNGELAHVFGPDGVLVVGSLTTASGAGNYIDAAANAGDTGDELQLPYSTDLDGNAVTRLEMAGLGSLDTSTQTGGSVTTLAEGYRTFYEAPVLTGTTSSVSSVANVYYKVLSGSVTYDGTTYTKNQVFYTDGVTTATTGSGTFALDIPPALKNECDTFRDEQFKIKHLKDGTESTAYYNFTDGMTPRSSLTCTDDTFFGFTV